MVVYECKGCHKMFKLKGDYTRHINRKTPCVQADVVEIEVQTLDVQADIQIEVQTLDVKTDNIIDVVNNIETHTDNTLLNDDLSEDEKLTQKNLITNINKNRHKCHNCNRTFTRSDSLSVHLDGRCPILKSNIIMKEELMSNLIKEMDEMKQEIAKLKDENVKYKTINTNNIQNAEHIQNNNNNINIIAYGKEDLSYILDKDFKQILNKGFKSVPTLVEYIHFNKDKPENHNIYISNMRDNYILIYDGQSWKLKERDDFLQDMIYNKSDILSDKFEELLAQLDDSTKKKFGNFLNEKDEDHVILQIKKDLKMILYNNKNLAEKSRELIDGINISSISTK